MILYISFLMVIWRENIEILISQEQLQDWSPDFPLFIIVSVFPFRINRKRREWRNTFYEPKGRGWIKWVDRKEHSLVIRHAPSVNHCDIMFFVCKQLFWFQMNREMCWWNNVIYNCINVALHTSYSNMCFTSKVSLKPLYSMCCSRSALIPVSLNTWSHDHLLMCRNSSDCIQETHSIQCQCDTFVTEINQLLS